MFFDPQHSYGKNERKFGKNLTNIITNFFGFTNIKISILALNVQIRIQVKFETAFSSPMNEKTLLLVLPMANKYACRGFHNLELRILDLHTVAD